MGSSNSDAECKKEEVPWKVRLYGGKIEVALEFEAKKMMLDAFNGERESKLKHSITLHASVSHFQLIQHLRRNYR